MVLLMIGANTLCSQPSTTSINRVLDEINALRANGCNCGDTYMLPAPPLKWNAELYNISRQYAQYLYKNKLFSHTTKDGRTLADRLDQVDYQWAQIGENLGQGYDDFYAVLDAWIESPSHCKMLMNPSVTDFGMSKYYDYWVQTFTKPAEYASH
jgi:uncharacterized protein YkwD